MLNLMKKVGTIFTLLIFAFLIKPQSVFAVAPACNNNHVDFNSSGEYPTSNPNCDSSSDCLAKTVGPTKGSPGQYFCWPKGATTTSPSCPSLTAWDSAKGCCAEDICQTNPGAGPGCHLLPHTGACIQGKNPFCSDIRSTFNKDSGVCEQVAATPWARSTVVCQGTEGIDTAIGCIPTGRLDLTVGFILKFVLGAAGGIMILMIISTGYSLLTSQGNPEKLAAARENIVSIFSGLILIAFSLILLQTVGANILGLPGF